MKIAISASMVFSEQMLKIKSDLEKLGHTAYVSDFAKKYAGKSLKQKETLTIFDKNNSDAIREFWKKIKKCDALLILNYTRRGIKNYIGGNTLMEIGFAHVLNKKIYLFNQVPNIIYYKSEIEATKPIVIKGDLKKIT